MPEPQNADGNALSVDDAVNLLDAGEDDGATDIGGDDTQDSAADDSTAADAGSPDDTVEVPSGEDEQGDATLDPEAEGLSPIDAPRSWNAEAKAKFKALPRDVQEIITARDGDREKALLTAQQESAESRKRVETESAAIGQYKAALDKLIPEAQATFENRWKNVDWDKVVDEFGAQEALKLQNQFQREQDQLQRLTAAQQAAQEVDRRKFVTAEFAKLKDVAPDLADEKEGPARRSAVGKFLIDDCKIPAEQLRGISAAEMALAYDAMRYRQAKANLAQKKPATPQAKTTVKPSVAKSAVAPQKQAVARLQARAFQSGSVDDMVALLDAEE